MTLLAASARRREIPLLGPPYNAATFLDTPTPDGTGITTHPSVVDMQVEHGGAWNGYRYWMAHTPYQGQDVQKENPCIAASNNGTTWVVPNGLTNPIDPWPGGAGYNSDTELVFDPDADTLYCFWRDYSGGLGVPGNLVIAYSSSSDGVTWTPQADAAALTYPGAGFSPAILRINASDWRMWKAPNLLYTASSVTGPWSTPVTVTFPDRAPGLSFWHWGIRRFNGVFYGLANDGDYDDIYAFSSVDGLSWSVRDDPIIPGRPAEWDAGMYRPTLTISNEIYADVWYGNLGNEGGGVSWRIGYTRIPLSEWPAPPTA